MGNDFLDNSFDPLEETSENQLSLLEVALLATILAPTPLVLPRSRI